jgi:hypothetical protein
MDPSGKTSLEVYHPGLGTTATGQTAKRTDAVTPGFAFKVVVGRGLRADRDGDDFGRRADRHNFGAHGRGDAGR